MPYYVVDFHHHLHASFHRRFHSGLFLPSPNEPNKPNKLYEPCELNELNEPYEPDILPLTTSPELDNLII